MNITNESLSQTDLVLKRSIEDTLPSFFGNHWGQLMEIVHPEFGVAGDVRLPHDGATSNEDAQFLIDSIQEQMSDQLLDSILQLWWDTPHQSHTMAEQEKWLWNRKGKVEYTKGDTLYYSDKDKEDFELLFKKAIMGL